VTTGTLLSRERKYPEAAAILSAAARGNQNETQVARTAAIYAKTRPYEELKYEPTDPRSVVQRVMGDLLSGKFTEDEGNALIYNFAATVDHDEYKRMITQIKLQLGTTGVPFVTIADMAMSNMRYTVDGDDSLGYKIILEGTGAAPQTMYVVKAGDHYQIAAFSPNAATPPDELAPLALKELEKNNLVAARKWLDRARDQIHMGGGDDPLTGPTFPHFWTKGQEGDAAAIRTAALVLLPGKQTKGAYLDALLHARNAATSDDDRNRLNIALASAYAAQEKWTDMLASAEQLVKAVPTSVVAFDLAATAYQQLGRFDDWDKMVQERMKNYPDELSYVRSSAQLAAYRGDFAKSRAITKTLLDKGQAEAMDMNQFAWYALLLPGPIDQESLDIAQRASDLTKNNNFAVLHTLACLDAVAGKTSQAHELLLKAMDALHIEEPNSEIWFGLAAIAEQYGVTDAAATMYRRVEKPKGAYPASSFAIAKQHLDGMSGKDVAATSPIK
jgi:tetratricopeptide (TPR) repeat protein